MDLDGNRRGVRGMCKKRIVKQRDVEHTDSMTPAASYSKNSDSKKNNKNSDRKKLIKIEIYLHPVHAVSL